MTDQATMLSTAAGRMIGACSATYWIPQPRRWAALINGKTRREHNESAQLPINGHANGQRRLRLRVTPGRTRAEHIKSASPPRSGHLADMPGRPLGATSGASDPNYEQKKSPAVVG